MTHEKLLNELRYEKERLEHQRAKIARWTSLDDTNKQLAYDKPGVGEWPISWGSPDLLVEHFNRILGRIDEIQKKL